MELCGEVCLTWSCMCWGWSDLQDRKVKYNLSKQQKVTMKHFILQLKNAKYGKTHPSLIPASSYPDLYFLAYAGPLLLLFAVSWSCAVGCCGKKNPHTFYKSQERYRFLLKSMFVPFVLSLTEYKTDGVKELYSVFTTDTIIKLKYKNELNCSKMVGSLTFLSTKRNIITWRLTFQTSNNQIIA